MVYPATGDQLAPDVQKTDVDPVVAETARDPSSDTRDRQSDASLPTTRDRQSDASLPTTRDRQSDASLPTTRDRQSDASLQTTRDRPSGARLPRAHSLLWPGASGVALFLFLLPTCFIITCTVVNIRSQPPPPPPSPKLPPAVRNKATDHRRAVLRFTRYLGRSLELYPTRRVETTITLWNPRTRKPEDLVLWYDEDVPVRPHYRSDQLVMRWLESMEELPVGPDTPKIASPVVCTSRHVGGCA